MAPLPAPRFAPAADHQTTPSPVAPQHAVLLDLLRALAAIIVFLAHIRFASFVAIGALPPAQQTTAVKIFVALTRPAREAVMVFFVLSGFLVGGQIIAQLQKGTFKIGDYVIDRCARIFLPLVPACLLTAALTAFVLKEPVALSDLFGSMLGLNGVLVAGLEHNPPLWSLAYEIWFYLLGGALGCLVADRVRKISIGSLFAIGLCLVVFSILNAKYLLYWALGAAMVLSVRLDRPRLVGAIGAALALCGVFLFEVAVGSRILALVPFVSADVAESFVAIGVGLLLPFCCRVRATPRLTRVSQVITFVSGFSYSLYLVHYPIIDTLSLWLPTAPTLSLITFRNILIRIVICMSSAILFYYLFERNTYALRRYAKRLKRSVIEVADR